MKHFHPKALSLDLEVEKNSGRIRSFAAIRADTKECLVHSGEGLLTALTKLDELASGVSFVLGHNLIAFDFPHLEASKPDLSLLKMPTIDTLRLNPLAFPRNPYHHLVKHYQDGGLKRGKVNDPKLDACLALQVFGDQREALSNGVLPKLLEAWHWLCTPEFQGVDRALDQFFTELRGRGRPLEAEAHAAIREMLRDNACATGSEEVIAESNSGPWNLAYALAWISVSEGNSVMPPWVRHQFPKAGRMVRRLRNVACVNPECHWCRDRHDAQKELKRWFGFENFRPEPEQNGHSMQRLIVESAMTEEHVFGILPTGSGKSLCYQLPAISRYYKTGALTVVISPLVALMADQVKGLESQNIDSCVAINGLLSMPERADALDRVRFGDAGILLISPEQLRSLLVRRALDQREIGGWVLDEAHCLSRWGHDFRPDYRYVARFIRQRAGDDPIPPVICLTATAKPDVSADISTHFREKLGIELKVFDGGTERSNLVFEVIPTKSDAKFDDIHRILETSLSSEQDGGAIVYCATRRQCEEIAEYLRLKEWAANYFHANLRPETKKDVQQAFIEGNLKVIAATNAFGMGIDKPDVRLVIHAHIPGSLENYFQEAGRAGRDLQSARCVLLYATDDEERQFAMSARSRLTRAEIHGILRALRRMDKRKRLRGEVVATVGEILGEDEEHAFERDSLTDDTRVRTSVAWLEEAELLTREENRVQIFPSSLRVDSVEAARSRIWKKPDIADTYRQQLLEIACALIEAEPDEGVTTDELMTVSGLSPEGVRAALYDLEHLGIASNDTELTAYVHAGVARASIKRLQEAEVLETALIAHMREKAPDLGKEDSSILHLRIAAQMLRDEGLTDALPERLWRIVRSIAKDGRGENNISGSLAVKKSDAETVWVMLKREWGTLEETARIRRDAAKQLLNHLLSRLPSGSRGTDLLASTTIGNLTKAIESALLLKSQVKNVNKLLDCALLWLHEQEVVRLNKGLAVFRPAMTIRLVQRERRRGFANTDFAPLDLHYKGQVLQIHVMAEFAKRGLASMTEALRLGIDYFSLTEKKFLERWLPGRDKEIGRETTPASWRAIVEDLQNPVQQRIVADDREQTNILILAGPGSGKTRVIVHRIAYLIRVRRENARGILALAYNRHAAVDIRRRLTELIGDDSRGVTVLTCHGLAMRLAGASFAGQAERPDDERFREVLRRAVELLNGEELPADEADEYRERLLGGFRWILVDEYQDIGSDEYNLISALAGRTLEEDAGKLTLFAVGDDDQNIYAFNGTSVEFIRRFEKDYGPRPIYLTSNYRSSAHIIAAANAMINPARERMKTGYPIHVNSSRSKELRGGVWEKLDPVTQGRIQILPVGRDTISQARIAIAELQRLAALSPNWEWSRCAVIAREWKYLDPVRAVCETAGLPAQLGNEEIPRFWHLRETRSLVEWLRSRNPQLVDGSSLRQWVDSHPSDSWHDLLRQAIEEHALETEGGEIPVDHFTEWLAEWGHDVRRRQQSLLLLTAHRAKGLEFDHVVVLDGGWDLRRRDEDPDDTRRLYYVAMTRARETLTLSRFDGPHWLQDALNENSAVMHREAVCLPPASPESRYRFVRLSLKEVNLGDPGRQSVRSQIHKAIAALSPGDPLHTRLSSQGSWQLLDKNGSTVGKLSKNFEPPQNMRCRSAKVLAIVEWNREISDPKYHENLKCDSWEVVVPELVFESQSADSDSRN